MLPARSPNRPVGLAESNMSAASLPSFDCVPASYIASRACLRHISRGTCPNCFKAPRGLLGDDGVFRGYLVDRANLVVSCRTGAEGQGCLGRAGLEVNSIKLFLSLIILSHRCQPWTGNDETVSRRRFTMRGQGDAAPANLTKTEAVPTTSRPPHRTPGRPRSMTQRGVCLESPHVCIPQSNTIPSLCQHPNIQSPCFRHRPDRGSR